MTISTTYAPVQYTGNAVTTAFAFPYPFFDNTDLLIYLDGVLQASGYTVTGGSGASGTVTFSSAPASGVIVTLAMSLPYTQLDNYVENQAFPADTLERGLDKAAIRDQQLNNRLNRSLVFPDTLTGSLVGELPQPSDGMLLAWDGTNGAVANVEIAGLAGSTIDTIFTGLASGDFLYYNGTVWVNAAKSNVPVDGLKATGSGGISLKNSGGTSVLTIGAGAGTGASFAGGLNVTGAIAGSSTISAVASLAIAGNSTAAGIITLAEDTDNGTNRVTITPPQSIASDYTVTLPSVAGVLSLETNGKQADSVYAEYALYANITTIIPSDDTIPQNTEGTQVLSVTITPKTATNKIRIRAAILGSCSSNAAFSAALFNNSTANALYAAQMNSPTTGSPQVLYLEFEHSPASTSAQTYNIRVGPSSAVTLFLNGTNFARLFGGVAKCTLTAEEIIA